jgi:hypothetical protein
MDSYSFKTVDCSTSGGGRAGGLALLWNSCNFDLNIIGHDLNYIDFLINSHNITRRATGIYGYSNQSQKFQTCSLINDLSKINDNPSWLIFGDFNICMNNNEKVGGNTMDDNIMTSFRNTINMCSLNDHGFEGHRFTWHNRQQDYQYIQARLDRYFTNTNWISVFPHYRNSHLLRYQSDHCPILLDFSNHILCRENKDNTSNKKIEQMWLREHEHYQIVQDSWNNNNRHLTEKLYNTLANLHSWGIKKFGNIPRKIKQTQEQFHHLTPQTSNISNMQLIREKEKELDDLLQCEELWWSQRSRAMWLKHGDKNTSFFHQKANQRKRKNRIEHLMDDQGIQHYEHEKIEEILLKHFKNLFTSQDTSHISRTVDVVKNTITPEIYSHLGAEFTIEEVTEAITSMKGLAAPGPDGLPAVFYHTYWDIIKHDVCKAALQVLNNGGDPSPYNQTNICLIPKKKNPTLPSDFRPISLCNVTLKVITKTIANRLKGMLPEVISPNQSAFIPGRLITDNTIVSYEVFNFFKQSKSNKGYIGIKTDMAKAYDRVEWIFLQTTLETIGFPQHLTNTIMQCVKTVNFSILINGKTSQQFYPQRGLRQGDPLSPYIFIICANVFLNLITKAQQGKAIHGVKIAHEALK